jgi:hypothetical protein
LIPFTPQQFICEDWLQYFKWNNTKGRRKVDYERLKQKREREGDFFLSNSDKDYQKLILNTALNHITFIEGKFVRPAVINLSIHNKKKNDQTNFNLARRGSELSVCFTRRWCYAAYTG